MMKVILVGRFVGRKLLRHCERTIYIDWTIKTNFPGENLLQVVNSKIWFKNVVMCGRYSLLQIFSLLY